MLPKRDAELIDYARFFVEEVRINQTKWEVRDKLFNPLRRAFNIAMEAWMNHTNAATASQLVRQTKDDAFNHLRDRINLMHDVLRGYDDTVTDLDLVHLRISPRKRAAREILPMPIVAPNFVLERSDFYTFIAISKEQEHGGQRTKRVRDQRLHPSIVVRFCYIPIDATLPVDREELEWTTNQATGNSRTKIIATGKAGLKLVAQSAFHNNAGTGPWSEPFEIIVS